MRGGSMRYKTPEGSYETIPENAGICRFVWEHLQVVNHILQHMKYTGGTYSPTSRSPQFLGHIDGGIRSVGTVI